MVCITHNWVMFQEANGRIIYRLDSMLGRQSRWPLLLEINQASGDVEFTWFDRDGDTVDFFCSFEALADETDDTWRAEHERRENLRNLALEERKRREALTDLDVARRAYLAAQDRAREVGVLRQVDIVG
jgi:hypothetical protein